MREYKFRAWIDDEKKYAYSDQECYTSANELIQWIFNSEGLIEVGYIHEESNEWVVLTTDVEQYTGLKDKNGKEIYEGDIVRNGGYDELCIVNYHQGQYIGRYKPNTPFYNFKEEKRDKDLHYIGLGFYVVDRVSIEVIGNIHDNPDLLGEVVE